MKSINLTPLIVLFAIIGLSTSYKWNKKTIPNPIEQPPSFCGLEEQGYPLCDPEHLLEPNHGTYVLRRMLNQYTYTQTRKCVGYWYLE